MPSDSNRLTRGLVDPSMSKGFSIFMKIECDGEWGCWASLPITNFVSKEKNNFFWIIHDGVSCCGYAPSFVLPHLKSWTRFPGHRVYVYPHFQFYLKIEQTRLFCLICTRGRITKMLFLESITCAHRLLRRRLKFCPSKLFSNHHRWHKLSRKPHLDSCVQSRVAEHATRIFLLLTGKRQKQFWTRPPYPNQNCILINLWDYGLLVVHTENWRIWKQAIVRETLIKERIRPCCLKSSFY